MVVSEQGQRVLLVRNVKDGASAQFGLGDSKIRQLEWVGSQDLALITSKTAGLGFWGGGRRENLMGFHLNLASKKLRPLLGATPRRSTTGTTLNAEGKNEEVVATFNVLAGPPEVRNVGVLASYSPALNVEQIVAPILLVHGKDDTVVPLEQSRIMAEALKKAGKPHELTILPGEDHWLTRGETRLQMLEAVVAFLEKHNPPR
ncbi:prolyl oligopeptidase family serine peptidase [Phenylobacterium sp.]|uniref:alpha/beta hydrolase family protein n=1 Tax=Phenylobacterium sp. TaxID=1871053 RepID=UPI0035AD9D3D